MANIELVIKIDEEQYEFIKESITTYYEVKDYHALMYDICERIKNGTPLPKNHGKAEMQEKIDKAIEEMNRLADHKIRPISFDQSVAIDMCIDILKKAYRKESEE